MTHVKPFDDQQRSLHHRVRALQVGAHEVVIQPNAYGRNTPWKKLGLSVPFVEDASNPSDQPGLYRCVRADVVYFKCLGGGLSVAPRQPGQDPQYLFDVGKTAKPADKMRFQGFFGNFAVQMFVNPEGAVYLAGGISYVGALGSNYLTITGGAWSLG